MGNRETVKYLKEWIDNTDAVDRLPINILNAIRTLIQHAERSQLVPLDEEKLADFIYKHRVEKDSVSLSRLICQTFGMPTIKWPEKMKEHKDAPRSYKSRNIKERPFIDLSDFYKKGYNDAIDACRRAYEEAGKES